MCVAALPTWLAGTTSPCSRSQESLELYPAARRRPRGRDRSSTCIAVSAPGVERTGIACENSRNMPSTLARAGSPSSRSSELLAAGPARAPRRRHRGRDRAHATRRRDGASESAWTWWESGQRHELLMLALRAGDLDEAAARRRHQRSEMERAQENRLWTLYTLAGLAQLHSLQATWSEAGLLWGAAETEARVFRGGPTSVPARARRARRGGSGGVRRRSGTGRALDLGMRPPSRSTRTEAAV